MKWLTRAGRVGSIELLGARKEYLARTVEDVLFVELIQKEHEIGRVFSEDGSCEPCEDCDLLTGRELLLNVGNHETLDGDPEVEVRLSEEVLGGVEACEFGRRIPVLREDLE